VRSILDPDWPVPEAFGSFGEQKKLELRFHDVIEEDAGRAPPQKEDVVRLLEFGRDLMTEPPEDALFWYIAMPAFRSPRRRWRSFLHRATQLVGTASPIGGPACSAESMAIGWRPLWSPVRRGDQCRNGPGLSCAADRNPR
jgi:hypothetical protein